MSMAMDTIACDFTDIGSRQNQDIDTSADGSFLAHRAAPYWSATINTTGSKKTSLQRPLGAGEYDLVNNTLYLPPSASRLVSRSIVCVDHRCRSFLRFG